MASSTIVSMLTVLNINWTTIAEALHIIYLFILLFSLLCIFNSYILLPYDYFHFE